MVEGADKYILALEDLRGLHPDVLELVLSFGENLQEALMQAGDTSNEIEDAEEGLVLVGRSDQALSTHVEADEGLSPEQRLKMALDNVRVLTGDRLLKVAVSGRVNFVSKGGGQLKVSGLDDLLEEAMSIADGADQNLMRLIQDVQNFVVSDGKEAFIALCERIDKRLSDFDLDDLMKYDLIYPYEAVTDCLEGFYNSDYEHWDKWVHDFKRDVDAFLEAMFRVGRIKAAERRSDGHCLVELVQGLNENFHPHRVKNEAAHLKWFRKQGE